METPVRGRAPHQDWHQVARGVWVPPAQTPSLRDELQAWTLVLPPGSAFTHLTGAELYG